MLDFTPCYFPNDYSGHDVLNGNGEWKGSSVKVTHNGSTVFAATVPSMSPRGFVVIGGYDSDEDAMSAVMLFQSGEDDTSYAETEEY
jgi:hypothetical protein